MDSNAIRRGVDGAWCLLALAALGVATRLLPGSEVVAPAILVIGAAITLLAIADASRSPAILGVPLLALALFALRDEREVLLAAGLVLAATLAVSASRWAREGELARGKALVLLVAALVPAAALPLDTGGLVAAGLRIAGAIAIVIVASRGGRTGIDSVMIAFCAAAAAPTVPLQASLFPFIVAGLVLLLRKPGPFTAGGFVLLVLAAGKWYLPLLLAAGAGFAATRFVATRGEGAASRAVALPFVSGMPSAAIAALATAPDAWLRARRAGTASAVTVVALAAGALLVQPSLATIYAVTAIACLLLSPSDGERRWSPALAAFVIAMSGLTAWSGAIASSFPLPLPVAVIVLLGFAAAAGRADGVPEEASDGEARGGGAPRIRDGWLLPATGAVVAGLAAAVILLHPTVRPPADLVAEDLRVAAGESATVDLPAGADTVRLRIAGGNVAGLKGGTVVGVVRAEPGGETRELRIGDFADWGAGRAEHYLSADNPRPPASAGTIRDGGRRAFLSGTGMVRLAANGATRLTVEALPSLGESGRLLVETVEVER